MKKLILVLLVCSVVLCIPCSSQTPDPLLKKFQQAILATTEFGYNCAKQGITLEETLNIIKEHLGGM